MSKHKAMRCRQVRRIVTVNEFLGPIKVVPQKPQWINDGSGNGWYVYPDGTITHVYVKTPVQFEKAIWKACDYLMITEAEAKAAIKKYRKEWCKNKR